MSKIALTELGHRAPGSLTRDYRAFYQHIPTGKEYVQTKFPNGREWVEVNKQNPTDPPTPMPESTYRVFTALMSDFGVGCNTTWVILENTLGVTPTISNPIPGFCEYYKIDVAPGTFVIGKTTLDFGPPQAPTTILGRVGAPSADQIEFFATDAATGVGAGGNLLNTMVEIRIYD